jgi:hypothetical protein
MHWWDFGLNKHASSHRFNFVLILKISPMHAFNWISPYCVLQRHLHPPFHTDLGHQNSVASSPTLRILSCLYSPVLCCSSCNVAQFLSDHEACNLVTATTIGTFQQRTNARLIRTAMDLATSPHTSLRWIVTPRPTPCRLCATASYRP